MEKVDFKLNLRQLEYTNNVKNSIPSLDLENLLHVPQWRGSLEMATCYNIVRSKTCLTVPVLSLLKALGVLGEFSRICSYFLSVCFMRVVQYSDKFMQSIVLYYIHITID